MSSSWECPIIMAFLGTAILVRGSNFPYLYNRKHNIPCECRGNIHLIQAKVELETTILETAGLTGAFLNYNGEMAYVFSGKPSG